MVEAIARKPPQTARNKGKRKPGRPMLEDGLDSREALLVAMHELMTESRGLSVPIGLICERAGVNPGMVVYHFDSKRNLSIALFERLCASWAPLCEQLLKLPVSPRRKLEIHVHQIIRNFQIYPYAGRLITELLMSSRPETAASLARNFVQPLADFYGRLIDEGVAAGEFRRIDPMYLFFSVVGMTEYLFAAQPLLAAAFGIDEINEEVDAAFAKHTTALILHGVSPTKAAVIELGANGPAAKPIAPRRR